MSRARRRVGFSDIDAARARRALRKAGVSNVGTDETYLNRKDAAAFCGMRPRRFDRYVRSMVEVSPRLPHFPLGVLERWKRRELPEQNRSDEPQDAPAPPARARTATRYPYRRTRRGTEIARQLRGARRRLDSKRRK